MLTFGAELIPRKGTKKVKMHKNILLSFSLLLIFFSCRPSPELSDDWISSSVQTLQGTDSNHNAAKDSLIINYINNNHTNEGFPCDSAYSELFYLSLNELLFDPVPLSCDYVEIVNRSEHPVNLAEISICNRNAKGELGSSKALSRDPFMLDPGAYCLLTSDIESLRSEFTLDSSLRYLIVKSMPSMPNDKGCVVLLDHESNIIDECYYSSAMHHSLLSNKEGIALEKIHPDLASAEAGSWISASADAAYGTPGRINSQYRSMELSDARDGFIAEQDWFAPYGDSKQNVWVLSYAFKDLRVANIGIYNRSGALLCSLAENALLGARGFFVWQGTDHRGAVPDAGSYLVHIEHFNLNGDVKKQNIVCRLLP